MIASSIGGLSSWLYRRFYVLIPFFAVHWWEMCVCKWLWDAPTPMSLQEHLHGPRIGSFRIQNRDSVADLLHSPLQRTCCCCIFRDKMSLCHNDAPIPVVIIVIGSVTFTIWKQYVRHGEVPKKTERNNLENIRAEVHYIAINSSLFQISILFSMYFDRLQRS